ncbi:MAG: type II toxin-antitoxin system RelB/DinJ family antitoxin [Fibromonadaceae bacterium]|nr:type II toxin-antitoxin system RelB/DinJ family antitoxin [Fibromonadaceae bacterium]
MSATVQIRVEPGLKQEVQSIFRQLGVDTTTAVNMFFRQCVRERGIPVNLYLNEPKAELLEAISNVENGINLYGPFATAEDAVKSMLED